MRDSRKWKMIPFVIIDQKDFYFEDVSPLVARHACIISPDSSTDNQLRKIQQQVDASYDLTTD